MGEIKNLLERNKEMKALSENVVNSIENLNVARDKATFYTSVEIAKDVVDNVASEVKSGMSLTTSTTSDNQADQGSSLFDKGFDTFTEAKRVKYEKIKTSEKHKLKEYDKELRHLEEEIKQSNSNLEQVRARANANENYSQSQKEYYSNSVDRAQEKLSNQEREVEELREKIESAEHNQRIKHKEEVESKTQYSESSDRFHKRDASLKETTKDKEAGEKLEKIGSKNDKLNSGNSLQKLRGGSESAAKAGSKEVAKEGAKAGAKAGGKAAAGAGTGAAGAGAAGAGAGAGAAGAGAGGAAGAAGAGAGIAAGGWIVLIVIAVIILVMIIWMVLAFIIAAFSGGGDSEAKREESESSNTSSYATAEERNIWNNLMEHFEGNETAVLGIMCNLQYESGFMANNLENINNDWWGISDSEYTAKINSGEISREDFLQSRYNGATHGYNNGYGWCNRDGGFGYCQYTAYSKKEKLYDYAVQWFSEGGEGAGKSFNIADPSMQAKFIVYLLENDYSYIDNDLKNAASVEDAVYIWCSKYEIPAGNLHDVAASRARDANLIKIACSSSNNRHVTARQAGGTDFSPLEGTYIFQAEPGPCVTCAVATMIKRYCYSQGDTLWDGIVPGMQTDDGESLVCAINGSASGDPCGWGCFDADGNECFEVVESSWYPFEGDKTIHIHNITCNMHTVEGTVTRDELISLLDAHPEGIAATGWYTTDDGTTGGHGKVITRYDSRTGQFYCIDPGNWGLSSHTYLDPGAAGRREVPLSDSRCWTTIDHINKYRYIE